MLLRSEARTVNELARELQLTDNAIRAHLVVLERDGLVQLHGRRRSSGKPASTYILTAEAEALFPKAYAQILGLVLAQVLERHGVAELEQVLRTVGEELASDQLGRAAGATLDDRLQVAKQVWSQLGGLADVRREGPRCVLAELSCPFGDIVPRFPEVCQLAQALLQTLLDTPVAYEHASRDGEPYCLFEFAAS
jgi:predicted ArsR family transcriptional regulator